jgi:hypothetical protein
MRSVFGHQLRFSVTGLEAWPGNGHLASVAIGELLFKQNLLVKNNYCFPHWQTPACGHFRSFAPWKVREDNQLSNTSVAIKERPHLFAYTTSVKLLSSFPVW